MTAFLYLAAMCVPLSEEPAVSWCKGCAGRPAVQLFPHRICVPLLTSVKEENERGAGSAGSGMAVWGWQGECG